MAACSRMMAPTCLLQAGYYRKRGLYPQQITAWRRAGERGRQQTVLSAQAGVDRNARKKVRALERELQRKEKALAPATARRAGYTATLLTLSKKARAIWRAQDSIPTCLRQAGTALSPRRLVPDAALPPTSCRRASMQADIPAGERAQGGNANPPYFKINDLRHC